MTTSSDCIRTSVIVLVVAILVKFSYSWLFLGGVVFSLCAGDACLLRVPLAVRECFRPPVDCDYCRHATSVVRLRNLTASTFEDHYAYSGLPIIVEDGTVSWDFKNVLNFDGFKKLYADGELNNCQFFPYQSGFKSLAEVFAKTEEELKSSYYWYIGWQNCDGSIIEQLRKHYKRPYFLPRHSEGGRSDWIFMGSPGYGADMHIDSVGNPSWQAQVAGAKEWTLQPAAECYFECPEKLTFTVYPEEIFVFDSNIWYHSTRVVGDNISISIGAEYD